MVRRLTFASTAALALGLVIALPVAAGGWASVSIHQGAPTDDGGSSVGITLLQHGVTPVDWGEVGITAVNAGSGERLTFTGVPRLSDGEWTTWIELPAGSWSLTVTHQDLEVGSGAPFSLTVGAPPAGAATAAGTAAQAISPALALVIGTVVLVLVSGAAGYMFLRRRVDDVAPAPGGLGGG